jgi:RNA polymerase sigma-70 factor (sigma-E family)
MHRHSVRHERGDPADETGFDTFAARRWRELMRASWLLTGDWAAAEDLVQETLPRVWTAWPRVSAADEPDAYVRRMLVNEFLGRRRRRSSAELPVEQIRKQQSADRSVEVDQRLVLAAALRSLPPVKRTVVVLRYFHDLSVVQTAAALGCSTGNVTSQSSRALATLRSSASLDLLTEETI